MKEQNHLELLKLCEMQTERIENSKEIKTSREIKGITIKKNLFSHTKHKIPSSNCHLMMQ